jgi:hypothetical protein
MNNALIMGTILKYFATKIRIQQQCLKLLISIINKQILFKLSTLIIQNIFKTLIIHFVLQLNFAKFFLWILIMDKHLFQILMIGNLRLLLRAQ